MLLFLHSFEYTSHELAYIPSYVANVYKVHPEIEQDSTTRKIWSLSVTERAFILNVGSDMS